MIFNLNKAYVILILAALFIAACSTPAMKSRAPASAMPEADSAPEAAAASSGNATTVGIQTGRAFMENCREDKGYGMYSYFLLPSPPLEHDRDKIHTIIKTFLRKVSTTESLESYFDKTQINITYLPVSNAQAIQSLLDTGSNGEAIPEILLDTAADMILSFYDFGCAKYILSKLPGAHHDGPYILTSKKPVVSHGYADSIVLNQDISWAGHGLDEVWVKEFLKQIESKRSFSDNFIDQLALNLRVFVNRMANTIPKVLDGFDSVADMVEKINKSFEQITIQ